MPDTYLPSEMAEAILGIPGGGSGTSDYNDLTNKPTINGVTVAGAQTSQSLKLQRELTKAEYDALTTEEKTNGTVYFITDQDVAPVEITADTGTSLSGVLMGNGSKVSATALDAAGGAASKAALDALNTNLATYVRPNLLDNWYFGNPVNQRGQTSYSGSGYTIDRWRILPFGSITLKEDGCNFIATQTANYKRFMQFLDFQLLEGETYTLSFLAKVNSINGYSAIRINEDTSMITDGVKQITPTALGTFELFSHTVTISNTVVKPSVEILVSNSQTSTIDIDIKAAKLELGSTQTLAHQENGVWVLNEIPNYGEQLAKCQRYQVVYTTTVGECVGTGYALSASEARIMFSLPQSLYKAPEFVIDEGDLEGLTLISGTNGGSVSGMLTPLGGGNGLITLRVQSNGLSSGQVYALRAQTKKISFIIDANL